MQYQKLVACKDIKREYRKGNTSDANKYTLTFAKGETPPVSFWSGRHVVSGSCDNTLRVWDLARGETKTTFQGHTDSASAVTVTPDGRHAVSGSCDNAARLGPCDGGNQNNKTTLQGHTDSSGRASHTRWSPRGLRLARLGSGDGENQNDAPGPYWSIKEQSAS